MGWTCFYDNVGLSIDVTIYRANAKQLSKAIIVEA